MRAQRDSAGDGLRKLQRRAPVHTSTPVMSTFRVPAVRRTLLRAPEATQPTGRTRSLSSRGLARRLRPEALHSDSLFFFYLILFIYSWLRWVFVAARGLSLVAVSGGYSSLQCAGFSLRWLLLLQSTGSRLAGFGSCGTRAE